VEELSPQQRIDIQALMGDIYVTDGMYRLPACLHPKTLLFDCENGNQTINTVLYDAKRIS